GALSGYGGGERSRARVRQDLFDQILDFRLQGEPDCRLDDRTQCCSMLLGPSGRARLDPCAQRRPLFWSPPEMLDLCSQLTVTLEVLIIRSIQCPSNKACRLGSRFLCGLLSRRP